MLRKERGKSNRSDAHVTTRWVVFKMCLVEKFKIWIKL